jgi:hypothetical protein
LLPSPLISILTIQPIAITDSLFIVARQSGWEHSDNQDGHFGGRGEGMIVAARR